MSADTIVLTYAELAERLGITIGSAKTRVRRARWHKMKGNDRKMRVHVPLNVLPQGDGESADQLREEIGRLGATILELQHSVGIADARAEVQIERLTDKDAEIARLVVLLKANQAGLAQRLREWLFGANPGA